MYMDDIEIFVKNENEQETIVQTIKLCNKVIGTEFRIEKFAMLIKMDRKTTKALWTD